VQVLRDCQWLHVDWWVSDTDSGVNADCYSSCLLGYTDDVDKHDVPVANQSEKAMGSMYHGSVGKMGHNFG